MRAKCNIDYGMRRAYIVYDWFYRLSHVIRRNRAAVLLYALSALLFTVVGIAVGVNIAEKTDYALRNSAAVFCFLRGDIGIVSFFFIDLALTTLYGLFALSMFFFRAAAILSVAPFMYRAYSLGMHTCIILSVYSASAIPMLFVFFVPVCIVEVIVFCMLSHRCFAFASLNGRCGPSRADIKEHYFCALPFLATIVICALVKAVTVALFGSALVGVI